MKKQKRENKNQFVNFTLDTNFTYDTINVKIYTLNQMSSFTGYSRTGIVKIVNRAKDKNETLLTFFHRLDKNKLYPSRVKYVFCDNKLFFVKVVESVECCFTPPVIDFTDLYKPLKK